MPVVVSKKFVGITDPHKRLERVRQKGETATGVILTLGEFMQHQGHASCLDGVFGMKRGITNYNATLFRFPLRQKSSKSKISDTCYTPDKVYNNLFFSLQSEAPKLLLFLKHVLKVEIYEWRKGSKQPVRMFSVQISNNVTQGREECQSLALAYQEKRSSAKVSVVLTSATTTCFEHSLPAHYYYWLMLNSVGSDYDELRAHADKANVLPWVGIAAKAPIEFNLKKPIVLNLESIHDVKGVVTTLTKKLPKYLCEASESEDAAGQAFCFLPLPGSISLPVNIHGYFAVADSRRSIKWPSFDERSEEAKWNKMLLYELISPLYALLLACRCSLIQYRGTSLDKPTTDAYAAWPVHEEVKNQYIWSELLDPVLSQIVNLPVLWTEADGGTWVTPNEAYFINPNEDCPQVALMLLVTLGYNVVSLSQKTLKTMLKHEKMKEIIAKQYIKAEWVQNVLSDQGEILRSLPKGQVYQLLEYILIDQSNFDVRSDLEVLPLCDGSLSQFTHGRKVFLFPEIYKDCLEFLPGIASAVVDTKIPSSLHKKLEELAGKLHLTLVTPDVICTELLTLSMKSWCPNLDKCIWQPSHHNHPPREWIKNVWTWIRKLETVDQVSSIPLVPEGFVTSSTKQVRLLPLNTSPKLCILPPENIPDQCSLDVMLRIVKMAGPVYVQQSDYVTQCPGTNEYIKVCNARFLLRHIRMKLESFSDELTSADKDAVHHFKSFSDELTSADKDALRHFIAFNLYSDRPLSSKKSYTLKSLPIFRAGVGGSLTHYIPLNTPNCVLPPQGIKFQEDIEYPPNILFDEGGKVTALLEKLKIRRVSSIDEFCNSIILNHATQKSEWSKNEEDLILWMLGLHLNDPTFLRNINIVRCGVDFQDRKSPADLYDPDEDVFLQLFDSPKEGAFPVKIYKEVLPVLRRAGMKTWATLKKDKSELLEFFIDRAKSIHKLSSSRARSKNLVSHLLNQKLIGEPRLSKIDFIFPQKTPPADYPSTLKWYGRDTPRATCPHNICCNSSEAYLVGSVVPIISNEYEIQGKHAGFHTISARDVVRHFREVVSFVSATRTEMSELDTDKVHDMVIKIYDFLSHFTTRRITDIPEQWIWWKEKKEFLRPDQCVLTLPEEISTLEPYLFCLSVNPELHSHVKKLRQNPQFPSVQLKQSLSKEDAVAVLKKMNHPRENKLTSEKVTMAVRILHWLKNHSHTPDDILIPTKTSKLALASECTYDNNWIQTKAPTLKTSKYTFVHEDVPQALAQYFNVTPLSHKVAPSKTLELTYTKAGQREPITRRIKQIVQEYATSSDILKELIQNADDAKATEVKFLIDWREHPTSTLLADELKDWQGPALIAYNNSVFTDKDFKSICELAAETKMKDPLKTGRFGVGFCATYHVTDVPSFISRHNFTMFDPHTFYLGERVSEDRPGMRIDLVENKDDLKIYKDQFQPYNGLFGCNIFNLPVGGFKGTLFRFPFRTSKSAGKSLISQEVNDRESIERLIQNFREQAPYLLLFLKYVRRISVSILENRSKDPSEMVTVVDVEKTCECPQISDCNRVKLIAKDLSSMNTECHCTVKYTDSQHEDTSQWIICSAVDKYASLSPHKDDDKQQGLLPFAEVAIKVQKEESGTIFPIPIKGYSFCFLPLPMKTSLPFHVNGFFDILRDRSGLKAADDERFGKEWNESLCGGALMQAYIVALSVLAEKSPIQHICSAEDKKKFLDSFYHMFHLSGVKGLIEDKLFSSVKAELPKSDLTLIWSDVSNGKWLKPRDIVLLEPEIPKELHESTMDIMLELRYNICQVPSHLVALLIDFLQEASTRQVYSYCNFCTDILMPNIGTLYSDVRNKHILFLLKNLNHLTWAASLLKEHRCIPVKFCIHLVLPSDLIDDREPLLRRLFEPEEGRFPADCLDDDRVMLSLSHLGMVKELSIDNIENRALTVKKTYMMDRERAAKLSWALLQYLQHHFIQYIYLPVAQNDILCNVLRTVSFLPAAHKPHGLQLPWCETDELVSPQKLFTSRFNNLVFSINPVVHQPEEYELHEDILSLVGSSQDPPLELVLSHLLQLSKEVVTDVETLSFIGNVMNDIYEYLQLKLKPKIPEDMALAKEYLHQKKFIWQNEKFLKADQVVLQWDHDCHPYLCKLSSENKNYQDLFVLLGVKEQPTVDDLAHILCRIACQVTPVAELEPTPVSSEQITFIEEIVKKMSEFVMETGVEPPQDLYLPDEHSIMRPVKQLACDRVQTSPDHWVHSMQIFKSKFEGGVCHFLHPSIPKERAITLGVKPLLHSLVQGLQDDKFLKGTHYGQFEDLCDRLKSILNKYPADYSILKEFIQNADDAQATEIVFILDHRKFSQKKLFSECEGWKDLQCTPALCIINNRKFTEDDIKGIAQLGRGGKRDLADTLGMFGIGFNVAYHVTDCPSFVSFSEEKEPENFCVFDPTCSFAPNVNKQNPGKRWILNPQIVADLPEQFEPYLFTELSNTLLDDLQKGHVVFRLPLTRASSTDTARTRERLSYESFDTERVSDLFVEMETYARDTLLFLNHVRKISALEIRENENGDLEFTRHFSTQISMSPEDEAKCHSFAREVNEMTKEQRESTHLTIMHKNQVLHEVPIKGTEQEKIHWLIFRKYVPLTDVPQKEVSVAERNLRPLGSVAASMGETTGRLFCSLPMPIETKLPVHVNGQFLVDDSRKHLEKVRSGCLNWNTLLAINVIAPCYVELLLHAQQMTDRAETDPKWFYSLFPSVSSESEIGNLKLVEEMYKILLDKNPAILLQQHPDTSSLKWFSLRGDDMGYFFLDYPSKETNKIVTANPQLQCALIRLGMAITTEEVPRGFYDNVKKVNGDYSTQAIIDPHKIISHLRNVDFTLPHIQAVMNIETIKLLLRFLIDGMTVHDLKKAFEIVPLLISSDGCLWKGTQIFKSAHASLLPHCSAHFVYQELEESSVGSILTQEEYGVIVDLKIEFVVDNITLSDELQEIEIYETSSETLELIKNLWIYLTDLLKSDITWAQVYFPHKPLLPTHDGYLYPMSLSDAIICSEGGNHHIKSTLKKLGYPTLSFEQLNMTEPCTGLVNKCSDGDDIISCFTARAPLICDANLSHEEVRAITESVRNRTPSAIADILRSLKIFETIDRTFISMKENPQVYIMPREIPERGIKHIQSKTSSVTLRGTDEFTVEFYRTVLHTVSAANTPQFYKQVVLPDIQELPIEDLQAHLSHIRFNRELKKDKGLMRALGQAKMIKIEERFYSIAEVCDPSNVFFTNFCSNRLLPDPWETERDDWLPFFKQLGLRHEVDFNEWTEHAKSFATDYQQFTTKSILDKSKALLDTLFDIVERECPENLEEASAIAFIYNESTPDLIKLVDQVFKRRDPQDRLQPMDLFSFKDSAMNSDSNLAALCKKILPDYCDEKLKLENVRQRLSIESPVQATTIGMNLTQLSKFYTYRQSSQYSGNADKLRKILVAHYAALDKIEDLQHSGLDIESLKETICVAVTQARSVQSLVLVKPSQLVMSLPSDIAIMEPFCYKVPPDIAHYFQFLQALDVPHELSARKCAQILKTIHQQLKTLEERLSDNDKYKRVALNAYNHMVISLRRQQEHLPKTLYLPSEDDELVINSDLLYNDAMWYARRLSKSSEFHFQFLKLPPPDAKGEKVPPPSLHVGKLTSVVSEELHEDMFHDEWSCSNEELFAKKKSPKRCRYVQDLQDTLKSPQLQRGLRRVYFSERKEKPSETFESALQELVNVHIKCVTSETVVTVLKKKDGTVIPKSESRNKYCHASVEEKSLVIAPHSEFDDVEFIQNLSSAIRTFLYNEIKNEAHIMAMLRCAPSDIERVLDRKQVSNYDPTILKETIYFEIGETIELETLSLEDCLVILNFSIGEKVVYHHSSGAMTIAEVVAMDDSIEFFWEKTITIKLESDAQKRDVQVSPLFIFKFLTPSQRIQLFCHPSEETSTRETAEPVDLADIQEDGITKFLNSALFDGLSKPAVAMATMRLITHMYMPFLTDQEESPDSPLKETAVDFLQRMIQFLEAVHYTELARHIKDIVANDLKIPGTQAPSQVRHKGHRRQKRPVPLQQKDQPGSSQWISQSLKGRRFRSKLVHDQPKEPPPPSHENAQIWLHQAKTDYRSALFLMGKVDIDIDAPISFEGDIQSKRRDFSALVCFLCHEAVEKCIKGVLYAYCGLKPGLAKSGNLVSLYEELKGSPHCPENLVDPIELCVMQINEHGKKSRHPNYHIPPRAPASVYTAANAEEACLATSQFFKHVREDSKMSSLLGELELAELPKHTGNDHTLY